MSVDRPILVATLAITAAAVVDVARRDELDGRTTALWLGVLTALFALRVVGQVVVWRLAPPWLPPMDEWNLVPYAVLLPIQLVFLAAMAAIAGARAEPGEGFGGFLVAFSVVYAAAMAMRYAVRMRRKPDARWFGGAIPIVFHMVLAAFLFTWGTYGASR